LGNAQVSILASHVPVLDRKHHYVVRQEVYCSVFGLC